MKKLVPAGLTPATIKLIRKFCKDLQGNGYTVIEASLIHGDIPIASVKASDNEKPVETFLKGCRLMLSSSEEINCNDKISPEEAETISAARLTARVALEKLLVDDSDFVGGKAHGQMAESVKDQEDIQDSIDED